MDYINVNGNGINLSNIYRVFDGKKYQFMGLYPNKEELKLDLERVHLKHGYKIIFEQSDSDQVNVWRRKLKGRKKFG